MKNINNKIYNNQFKLLNMNLKTKLKKINKYDEGTLNLLFYKLNKQIESLSKEELNKIKRDFEKECYIKENNECCIDTVVVENNKKINKSLKLKLKEFEEKISNLIEFREEAILSIFSFLLFVWFLISGFINIGMASKIIAFVSTIVFFAFLDKYKTKNKIDENKKISSGLKNLVFMICFSLAICILPSAMQPSNFNSTPMRVDIGKNFIFKLLR